MRIAPSLFGRSTSVRSSSTPKLGSRAPFRVAPFWLLATVTVVACRDGATTIEFGVPGSASGEIRVVSSSLVDGVEWQLNRPIDIVFDEDVDFDTVSQSTVAVRDLQGVAVVGSYRAIDPRTVRFQPLCPIDSDTSSSNGGLRPDNDYQLILGAAGSGSAAGVSVQSTAGGPLRVGYTRTFQTPDSTDPRVLFFDPMPGPPRLLVRGQGDTVLDSGIASYVEFGEDPEDVSFFQDDGGGAGPTIDRNVPLNLYSRAEERFAIVLRFDQPIAPTEQNLASDRIRIDALLAGTSVRVPSRAQLVQNCEEGGALVRLVPLGLVPQAATLRVTLGAGLADLTGQAIASSLVGVLSVESDVAGQGASTGDGADEILESFLVGANSLGSLEDPTVPSPLPRAVWGEGDGGLVAGLDLESGGGPGGDFDWTLRTGDSEFFDTTLDVIQGGPDGDQSRTQVVSGGVIECRNFTMEGSSRLIVIGPNPLVIRATGAITINGELSVDGASNTGVGTLNTTNFPEPGAPGRAGGGDGGTSSQQTAQSTARGGSGEGAFGASGQGGQGGESGYALGVGFAGVEARRAAGGGGGRFGVDVRYPFEGGPMVRCQTLIGMDAEPGFTGSLDGTGAVSLTGPAAGGAVGPEPFLDADPSNNFFGTMLTADGEQVLGELPSLWAGAGGGAGGDAVRSASFPLTPFSPFGDEKGAGGGAGGGGVLIQAVGPITLGPDGSITADGGSGNGGENVFGFDRIGGGSGGGSGGHIVLSSASRIVIEAAASGDSVGTFYADDPESNTHELRPLSALGGQGGVGRGSRCGYGEDQRKSQWRGDAIPMEAFEGNDQIPPQNQPVWLTCNFVPPSATAPPEGTVVGGGGDGSPGLIQLHVQDPATQILFPNATGVYGAGLDPTASVVPPPIGWTLPDAPVDGLVPFVGSRSDAYSRWIPLGAAGLNPDGSSELVQMLFAATDPATGEVRRDGDVAFEEAPLIDWGPLGVNSLALPSADLGIARVRFDSAALDDLYVTNPALLRAFALRIRARDQAGALLPEVEFTVVRAQLGADSGSVDVFVDGRGSEFADRLTGVFDPEVQLVPFQVRVRAGDQVDALQQGTAIRITFDATRSLSSSLGPDAAQAFSGGDPSGFATDIAALNSAPWDFIRFRVEFDLDTDLDGIEGSLRRPALDLLKLPFRF